MVVAQQRRLGALLTNPQAHPLKSTESWYTISCPYKFNTISKNKMEPPPRASTSLFEVYLRLRPSNAVGAERFLNVEQSDQSNPTHITIKPPSTDHRKRAVEKFAFTRVFEEDAAQLDIFKGAGVVPLIEGVLGTEGREGRDGLLATLGVTGSGKACIL